MKAGLWGQIQQKSSDCWKGNTGSDREVSQLRSPLFCCVWGWIATDQSGCPLLTCVLHWKCLQWSYEQPWTVEPWKKADWRNTTGRRWRNLQIPQVSIQWCIWWTTMNALPGNSQNLKDLLKTAWHQVRAHLQRSTGVHVLLFHSCYIHVSFMVFFLYRFPLWIQKNPLDCRTALFEQSAKIYHCKCLQSYNFSSITSIKQHHQH